MNAHERHWWPVAPSALLKQAPLAVTLLGRALVLFRGSSGEPGCLLDRCPHRQAPLSAGEVMGESIRCPYHGWEFDRKGMCARVPGMDLGSQTRAIASAFPVQERYGLLWVSIAEVPVLAEPAWPCFPESDDYFLMTASVHATLEEVAENFLDPFHTHFVHRGLVRIDQRRRRIGVNVKSLPDGIEARYEDDATQDGWISRLLEGDRTHSFGRFRLPGLAEIEYHGRSGRSLAVSAYLTPMLPDRIAVHALVATPRRFAPAWLKRAVLRAVFAPVLRQDREIVEMQHRNRALHGAGGPMLDTELDILGPSIRRLLSGSPAEAPVSERTLSV
jgi:phenylpropionate dioxygenase-like ring-hydroxylating dioxygenase large terminal subunit